MSDIERIHLIHKAKTTFSLDEKAIKAMMDQVESSSYKQNIQRFFSGYSVEENFNLLFSCMPWVKLVHGLEQAQMPSSSKESYQVPDAMVFYETSSKQTKALGIEVKSVTGKKRSLRVMSKQAVACKAYMELLGRPLLYAIFWEQFGAWTLNCLDHFQTKRGKMTIGLFHAVENDLSVLLGDLSLIIPPITRHSICDPTLQSDTGFRHEEYGPIISDEFSADGKTFVKCEPLESAVIDSVVGLSRVGKRTQGHQIELIEESATFHVPKFSRVTTGYLALFGQKVTEKAAYVALASIRRLAEKLRFGNSYMVPARRTQTTDMLFQEAFGGTWVWDRYLAHNSMADERRSKEADKNPDAQ